MPLAPIYFEKMRPSPKEVARLITSLPSAPQVLPRLYHLLREGGTSLQQVGALIRIDPGLTVRVFELGTRYAHAKGELCFTIEDAINWAGFDAIDAMVAHVADEQIFARPISLYNLDAEEMWRWSIACAFAAETIAEFTGDDAGVAFTTGLLHCAGMIALDEWTQRSDPMLTCALGKFPREFADAERSHFGLTQADVGAELLKGWRFPSTIVEPVRWQYTPLASSGYARTASILHAAKWLRAVICDESEVAPCFPAPVFLETLRISSTCLARMVIDVRVKLGGVRNLLHFIAA